MRVVVFGESPELTQKLRLLTRGRTPLVELKSREELPRYLSAAGENGPSNPELKHPDLIYIDVSGMPAAQRTKSLRRLLAANGSAVGILDPHDDISDPAAWFHQGIADYINPAVAAGTLNARRFEQVLKWWAPRTNGAGGTGGTAKAAPASTPAPAPAPAQTRPEFPTQEIQLPKLIPSPAGWSSIRSGAEYSFAMLYVGLDLDRSTGTDSRAGMLQNSLKEFRAALQEEIAPAHGKLWFWKDTAGLILFPFDGESPAALLTAMRIVLRRVFWQAHGRTNYLTRHFRLALDIGNTIYHEGSRRETLVSDMVNYMFHLGSKHARAGQFVLSDTMLSRCPPGLRPYFVPCGSFGGKQIWRMRTVMSARNPE